MCARRKTHIAGGAKRFCLGDHEPLHPNYPWRSAVSGTLRSWPGTRVTARTPAPALRIAAPGSASGIFARFARKFALTTAQLHGDPDRPVALPSLGKIRTDASISRP